MAAESGSNANWMLVGLVVLVLGVAATFMPYALVRVGGVLGILIGAAAVLLGAFAVPRARVRSAQA